MNSDDEEALLAEFDDNDIEKRSDYQWLLANGEVQLLRCQRSATRIISGRIAIWTRDKSETAAHAERVFKALEKKIKLEYVNELTCRNINIDDSCMPWRKSWVGPGARLAAAAGTTLTDSVKGIVVYELAEYEWHDEKMGKKKPCG